MCPTTNVKEEKYAEIKLAGGGHRVPNKNNGKIRVGKLRKRERES